MGQFDFTTGVTALELGDHSDIHAFMVQGFKFSTGVLSVDVSADGFRTVWIPTGKKSRYDTSTGEISLTDA